MASEFRHENKYLIDEVQKNLLQMRLPHLLKLDPYSYPSGYYIIRSLYFDDLDDRCYYENLAGIEKREKYRIRIYNNKSDVIYLEKKSKLHGMTHKEKCRLSKWECKQFMKGVLPDRSEEMSPIKRKLFTEMRMKEMRPVTIVEYTRIPYIHKAGNVRITLDDNLKSSQEIDGFLEKGVIGRPVFPVGCGLLEVKWDEFLPVYINKFLDLETMQWSSFSKYCLCRKYNIYGGIRT